MISWKQWNTLWCLNSLWGVLFTKIKPHLVCKSLESLQPRKVWHRRERLYKTRLASKDSKIWLLTDLQTFITARHTHTAFPWHFPPPQPGQQPKAGQSSGSAASWMCPQSPPGAFLEAPSQPRLSLLLLPDLVSATGTGCKDSAALSNLLEIHVCVQKLEGLRGRPGWGDRWVASLQKPYSSAKNKH